MGYRRIEVTAAHATEILRRSGWPEAEIGEEMAMRDQYCILISPELYLGREDEILYAISGSGEYQRIAVNANRESWLDIETGED